MQSGRNDSTKALWETIQTRLRAELGEDIYRSWFARLTLESVSPEKADEPRSVVLSVPTRFLRSWIRSKYFEELQQRWEECLGQPVSLDIALRASMQGAAVPSSETAPRAGLEVKSGSVTSRPVASVDFRSDESLQNGLGSPLDPRLTFDSFIVGDSNSLAHAGAQRIAFAAVNHPLVFNPFYVHASVGLGKTHLLQATAWAAKTHQPRRRVLYMTAERFMYGFVNALKDQSTHAFKELIRGIDLMIVDDLQFLQGNQVQQEFCHTLNALIDSNKQIMVAADRPHSQLEALNERVSSRLSSGFPAEIGALDRKLRKAILQDKAQTAADLYPGFSLSDDVIDFVSEKIQGSGRDLEGAFNRLLAHNQLTLSAIDVEIAERSISDLIYQREPKRILIEDIQRVVARHYNVSRSDLVSARRTRVVVRPRQVAMYLAKAMTPRSLPEIGRRFGGRDHTTVLHAVRKIETSLPVDQLLAQEIEVLRRMIEE